MNEVLILFTVVEVGLFFCFEFFPANVEILDMCLSLSKFGEDFLRYFVIVEDVGIGGFCLGGLEGIFSL